MYEADKLKKINSRINFGKRLLPVMAASILFPTTFLPWYNAYNFKNNEESIVNVSFEKRTRGIALAKETLKLSLIGSTEKFMFFYNHSDKCTIVLPIAKIISITADNITSKQNIDKKKT